jgi:Cu(I)/Ag(I) efflux system membrane protein CusA/SilA
MIGGMVSSTVLTLVVIPAIYALVKRHLVARDAAPSRSAISPTPALEPAE